MGNMPAIASANTVMASAKRLIEAPQGWRVKCSAADMKVPDMAMAIHQT